jgi:hypothetical protein
MANYATSVLLEARKKLGEMSQDVFNQRAVLSQVEPAFNAGRKFIPNLNEIREANTQTAYVEYLTAVTDSLGSAKACSPSGTVGDSSHALVSLGQLVATASMSEKRHHGNDYKMAEALANRLIVLEKNLLYGAGGLEALMVAYLEANRTYVNDCSAYASRPHVWWAAPQYYLRAEAASIATFYSTVQADFGLNDYVGELWDVHNMDWTRIAALYAEQGTANNVNYSWQFDGIHKQKTNHIVPTGYEAHKHYIFRDGAVAWWPWNDPVNKEGKTVGERTWTTYESKFIPGLLYDLFIYSTCSDSRTSGGDIQDIVHQYELTINYSFAKQPLDTVNETPIVKYVNWS